MTSPVIRLPFTLDVGRLNRQFEEKRLYDHMPASGTLSLMHRPGAEDPWSDGTTTYVLSADKEFWFSERDFTEVNPLLASTYFEDVVGVLRAAAQQRLGRVRLFRRPPQSSSSLHSDLDVRLHVALETSPDAFICFPGEGMFHIPADGHVYLIDTTRRHFAVNASSSRQRTHLVCSTYCGFAEKRSLQDEILRAAHGLFEATEKIPGSAQVAPVSASQPET